MGLEQQWQCQDSSAALLPGATASHDSMVFITPNKARNADNMGKGARMPSTVHSIYVITSSSWIAILSAHVAAPWGI